MTYKFSNEVLAAVVQLVQLALLTETDISDHLRLLEVEPATSDTSSTTLTLTSVCREQLQKNVDDLNKRAQELFATAQNRS
jgi:hypothetical protein